MAREPRGQALTIKGRSTRRAVDTFSLGCMLHYCLSGGGIPSATLRARRTSPRAQNLT